jgi:hypothetical protein
MPGNGMVAVCGEMAPVDVCGGERRQHAHLNRQAAGTRDRVHALQQRDIAVVGRRATGVAVCIDITQGERYDWHAGIDGALKQRTVER